MSGRMLGLKSYNDEDAATVGYYNGNSSVGIIFIQNLEEAMAENKSYWASQYPDLWDWLLHKPEQIYYVLHRDDDEEYLFIRAYPLRE